MRRRRLAFPRSCAAATVAALILFAGHSPVGAQPASRPAQEAPPSRETYAGHRVVQVLIRDAADAAAMEAISPDLWSHRIAPNEWATYRVPPDRFAALEASGLTYRTVVEDLAPLIDAERTGANVRGASWFDDYHTLEDIYTRLGELVALRPDLATEFVVGQSIEARDIMGVSITGPGAEPRPAIALTACQHAREWISPAVAMYIIDTLITQYDTNPDVQALVDNVEWIIVPMVNPDGYSYTWTNQRLWRKNRRPNSGGSFGVDLNRNWSTGWGLNGGSSTSQTSDTYHGTGPFSEPETAAVRDLFMTNPDIVAHIDFHSFSQYVLSSWGWTTDPAPDAAVLGALGAEIAESIESLYGTNYISGPASTTLYIASGTIPDWSYDQRGALSWTIELRPGPDNGSEGFILPADQIIPTCEETFPAVAHLADVVTRPINFLITGEQPEVAAPGEPTPVAVSVTPGFNQTLNPATLALNYRPEGGGSFSSTPLTLDSGDVYLGELPGSPCGQNVEWFVSGSTVSGESATFPPDGAAAPLLTFVGVLQPLFEDNAESNMGWTLGHPSDTATTGIWVRAAPNVNAAQPAEDNPEGTGTLCFITGADAPGAPAGTNDVDNGYTSLLSPTLDATSGECFIRYYRWYSNNAGANPNSDSMPVYISNDGGANWVLLEQVDENAGAWVRRTFRVSDFVTPTDQIVVGFQARDDAPGSVVEAGVDDFALIVVACPPGLPGDLNGDCTVDSADLGLVIAAYGASGPALAADLNGDNTVDTADLGVLIANFGADCP